MERKNAWLSYNEADEKALEKLAKDYRTFLDNGKTERECVSELSREAEAVGYVSLDKKLASGEKIQTGDKIYAVNKDKAVALFIMGKNKLENGMKIIGGHIDSPRIDLKPHPLYQEANLGFFKTHYYGGIKKYQWSTIPLAIHGLIILNDGQKVDICIGEDENDPVFCITDLLPHLAQDQMQKKLADGITGEQLNLLIGSIPLEGSEKEAIEENILKILNSKYGIIEEDLLSAEIEIVPAGKARDLGLDRSMVLAYGHDDRVCSYGAVKALIDTKDPEYCAVALCVDKEEVGSQGNTGMHSKFFENTVAELMDAMGQYSELKLKRCLAGSYMLSSDVSAAYDPNFASAFEKKNRTACHFVTHIVRHAIGRNEKRVS